MYCEGRLDKIIALNRSKKPKPGINNTVSEALQERVPVDWTLVLEVLDPLKEPRCSWGNWMLADLAMGVWQKCMVLTQACFEMKNAQLTLRFWRAGLREILK